VSLITERYRCRHSMGILATWLPLAETGPFLRLTSLFRYVLVLLSLPITIAFRAGDTSLASLRQPSEDTCSPLRCRNKNGSPFARPSSRLPSFIAAPPSSPHPPPSARNAVDFPERLVLNSSEASVLSRYPFSHPLLVFLRFSPRFLVPTFFSDPLIFFTESITFLGRPSWDGGHRRNFVYSGGPFHLFLAIIPSLWFAPNRRQSGP